LFKQYFKESKIPVCDFCSIARGSIALQNDIKW